ncbi:hypothetical protein PJL18_01927 [Paenarthrobacter nicotinovorans]|nr:hypothetical protein [Paenarthrobacter nicotinovorans]
MTQTAVMDACLPEQFCAIRVGPFPARSHSSRSATPYGRSVLLARAWSLRPCSLRISVAPSRCIFAPEWLAAVSARRFSGMSRPAFRSATACSGFRLERGYMGASGWPASMRLLSSAESAISEP